MRALLAAALLACASGCAGSPAGFTRQAEAESDAPAWHLHVDTNGRRLGAYTIAIRYDANIAVIQSIDSCDVRRFKGSPEYDPATFGTGVTRVTSLDAFPGRAPDDEYHLLTITFRRLRPGPFAAAATIDKLYDDANKPFRGKVTLPTFVQ